MIAAEVKYKKTGIDWLAEIPEHWSLLRFKNVYKECSGNGFPNNLQGETTGDIPFLKVSDINGDSFYVDKSNNWVSKQIVENNRWNVILKGTIIAAKIGEALRKNHRKILLQDSLIDNNCIGFYPLLLSEKYSFYLLKLLDLDKFSNPGAVPSVSLRMLRPIKLPIPPIEEQKAIADYLDTQSAKITHFIQTKQRFIELLKEQRQSIIEIALKSEENWTKSKIKHIAKMFGRIGFRGYQTSDLVDKGKGAITISPSNMKDNKMDFNQCSYLSWAKYEESPEIKIFQGDILFVKTGATYGKVALVPELPEKATINPQLMVFKELKIDAEYFCFYLQTGYIKEQVEKTVIGGTIPTISQTKVGTFQVFYPSPTEQKRIVEHIKTETRTLDIAISKAEREIELIKEYREAMIAEAVTGKMSER